MTEIDIQHTHSLGKQAGRARVDEIARELATRFGLGGMAWSGDTLAFTGHGIEGSLEIDENDVRVRMKLGMLLGLMRPLIEAETRRRLREHFG